jgi:DNA-binding NarL/FixJ family response regulator
LEGAAARTADVALASITLGGIPQRHVIDQMRRAAIRGLLIVVLIHAVARSVLALLTSGASTPAQTAFAATVAIAITAWALARAEHHESDLQRAPWVPLLATAVGALALVLDAPAASTMFATFLPPIAVYSLYAYWKWALLATAILIGGYLTASTQPGMSASLETMLGAPVTALAVVAGCLIPVKVALSTLDARAASVTAWRAATASTSPAPGRPGMASEHDTAILAGILAGKSDKMIAYELGMGDAKHRVRDRRRHLEKQHGVRSRAELAKVLHNAQTTIRS